MYRGAHSLKSTVVQARPSAKTTLGRGKITFARDIQFGNNIINASAEGASAIFIGMLFVWISKHCHSHTNDTRADETTVAYATVKMHPCIMNIYIF